MPTAARLVAALCFAAIAFLASDSYKPLLPTGTNTRLFSELNALLGAMIGWRVMGRLVGDGYQPAMASGLRTALTLMFYTLLVHSVYQMLKRSTRMVYDGVMDAIVSAFDLAVKYGTLMVTSPQVMAILLIGGVLAGLLAEWVSRRWS
ncbi:hypothetical protein JT55_10550 [Rhodovulum sp. NI22]|jgi:hypothetical protein|nr:hypothetical protein JT55_10550 [Rhodovulum sp. NI22]